MHIVTKKRLQEFWVKYPDSQSSLNFWYGVTKKAVWENLAETREDFPHADLAAN